MVGTDVKSTIVRLVGKLRLYCLFDNLMTDVTCTKIDVAN